MENSDFSDVIDTFVTLLDDIIQYYVLATRKEV